MKKLNLILFALILLLTLIMAGSQETYALDLDPTMDFSGQKITFLGDSLTAGSELAEENRWPYLVAHELGFETYVNMGENGAPVSDDAGRTSSFVNRVSDVPTDSDYVLVMGAANDMGLDVTIADFTTDLEYVVAYLRTNLPNAQIILMTYFDYGGDAATNTNLDTLEDYYDVIRTTSYDKIDGSIVTGHVQLLDLNAIADVTTEEAALYTYDGHHPSVKGSRIIANIVSSFLAGEDLIADATYVTGYILNTGAFDLTGNLDAYAFTEGIDVVPGKSYVMYTNKSLYTDSTISVLSEGGAFYEADGTFISTVGSIQNVYFVMTAPANAAYVMINTRGDNQDVVFLRELINEFTVVFNTDEGTLIDTVLAENLAIEEPITEPTKSGYVFDGWYEDETFTTVYDFTDIVNDNITIYAKWISDGTTPVVTVITPPAETLSFLGIAWYWWTAAGVAVYYLGFTKKGRKIIGLK